MVMTTSPKRSVIISSLEREHFHLMDLAHLLSVRIAPTLTKSGRSAFTQNRHRRIKTAHYLFSLGVGACGD